MLKFNYVLSIRMSTETSVMSWRYQRETRSRRDKTKLMNPLLFPGKTVKVVDS